MDNTEGICVAIRIRPLNDREISGQQERAFKCLSNTSIALCTGDASSDAIQTFNYDRIFDDNSSTKDVYEYTAKESVAKVVQGINGTIFAYGQTSSGKTFTMLGDEKSNQRGVLEMAAEDIFTNIARAPDRDFLIRVSFVEIYNEKIFDLLSDSIEPPMVNIREDPRKGVYCETTEVIITSHEDILKSLRKGTARRHVAETLMNEKSSRSHTIFRVVIESKVNAAHAANGDGAVLVASLNLVDLAGSESVRLTGATGQRAKEGGKINQSLLSLSRVIQALSQPGQHVSFRDSQLTRLLQPSLSGNARMSIVCCITPADRYLEETKSTLQFASRAKLVKTHATVNEVVDESVQIRRLKKELEELKRKYRKSSSDGSVSTVGDFDRMKFDNEKNELLDRIEFLEVDKENNLQLLNKYRAIVPLGNDLPPTPEKKRSKTSNKRETWCPSTHTSRIESSDKMSERERSVDADELQEKIEALYSQLQLSMIAIKERDLTIESLTTLKDEISERFDIEMGAAVECERELREQINSLEMKTSTMSGTLFDLEQNNQILSETLSATESKSNILLEEKMLLQKSVLELAEEREELSGQMNHLAMEAASLNQLKMDHINLLVRLEGVETEKNEVHVQLEDAKEQVTVMQSKLQEKDLFIEALERDAASRVQDMETIIESLRKEIESKDQQLSESTSTSVQAQEAINGLMEDKESLKNEVNSLQSEMETWNARYDESSAKIEALMGQLNENQATNEHLMSARDEIIRLEELTADLMKEKDEVTAELSTSKGTIRSLQGDIDNMQAAMASSADSKQQLDDLLIEVSRKEEEMAALKGEYEEIASKFAILSTEKESLLNQLQSHSESSEEMMRIMGQNEAYLDEIKNLKDEYLKLQAFSAETSESYQMLQMRCDELTKQIVSYEQCAEELAVTRSDLENMKQDLSNSQAAYIELETRFDQLTGESLETRQYYEAELQSMQSKSSIEMTSAKESIQALEIQLQQQRGSYEDQLTAASEELKETKADYERRIELYESELKVMNEETERVMELLNSKEEDDSIELLNQATNKITDLQDALKNAELHVNHLESENLSLATELKESHLREEELVNAVQESDTEMVTLREQIIELEHQLESAVEDYNIALADIERLKQELSAAMKATDSSQKEESVAKMVTLTNERMVYEKQIVELEEKIVTLQHLLSVANESSSVSLKAIEIKFKESQQEVEKVRSELGLKEAEVSKLSKFNDELQSKLKHEEKQNVSFQSMNSLAQNDEHSLRKRCSQLQTSLDLLQSEKEVLARKLSESISETKQLQHQVVTMEKDFEKRQVMTNKHSGNVQDLQSEVQRGLDTIKTLQMSLGDMRAQNNELSQQLLKSSKYIEKLENDLFELKNKSDNKSVDDSLDKEKVIEELRQQLFESQKRCNKSKDEINMFKSELQHVEKELQELLTLKEKNSDQITLFVVEKEQLSEQLAQMTAIYEEAKAMANNDLNLSQSAKYQEEVGLLTDRIASLETELQAAKSSLSEKETLVVSFDSEVMTLSEELEEKAAALVEANRNVELLSERVDSHKAIHDERNALVEEKLELLSRVSKQEATIKEFETKLNDYDRSTAKEQQLIVQAATLQIDSLKERIRSYEQQIVELESSESLVSELRTQIEELHDRIQSLHDELENSQSDLHQKDEKIENLSSELATAKASSQEAKDLESQLRNDYIVLDTKYQKALKHIESIKLNGSAHETTLSRELESMKNHNSDLKMEMDGMMKDLESNRREVLTLKKELSKTSSELAATRIEMEEALEVKDKRIVHLEASKLTKDQLEKIKVIKEERKKYLEEAKELKRQLVSLKKSYDELKSSGVNSKDKASAEELHELEGKYDMAQETIKSLKDKLRECSKQLKIYETERESIIDILDKHGMNTHGLLGLDTSVSEDASTYSISEQDLSTAISKLVLNLQNENILSSKKLHEAEGKLSNMKFECEELNGAKAALEKRVEYLKTSTKSSREESVKLSEEIDLLTSRVQELTDELTQARQKAVSGDVVHSEIQALQEENIEIMTENKNLRKEMSKLRSQIEKANQGVRETKAFNTETVSVEKPKVEVSVEVKEAENVNPVSNMEKVAGQMTRKRSFGHELSENNLQDVRAEVLDGSVKGRRVRNKVIAHDKVSTDAKTQVAEDAPGECNQS